MNSWDIRLRSRLTELGMTQKELAIKSGITVSAISHYLAKRRVPRLSLFAKLADNLECDITWLLYGESEEAPTRGNPEFKRKKGGGGKLNRSEIIQARLDPKLHVVAEMMARSQRRTLSSLIETLLDTAIENYMLSVVLENPCNKYMCPHSKQKTQELSLKEIVNKMWSSEEADRFAAFAYLNPDLLDQDELRLWELVLDTKYFWEALDSENEANEDNIICDNNFPIIINRKKLIKNRLREKWHLINRIVEGNESIENHMF